MSYFTVKDRGFWGQGSFVVLERRLEFGCHRLLTAPRNVLDWGCGGDSIVKMEVLVRKPNLELNKYCRFTR